VRGAYVVKAHRLLTLVVLTGACGGTPSEGVTGNPSPPPPEPAPASLPSTSEGSAPGLCSQWTVSPVDLSMLPSSSDTASLVARSDARGGITVVIVDREGNVTANAFRTDGTPDGAPLQLAAPQPEASSSLDAGASPPVVHDVEATPDGWLVSWDGSPSAGWVDSYDAVGRVLFRVPLATNAATVDLAPDGTVGINDGASIGWVAPGQRTEQIAVTYAPGSAGSVNLDPGPFAAWSAGIAYVAAPDLSANIETVAPGGTTYTFPGPALGYSSCGQSYDAATGVLLPGVGGQSASVVSLCTAASPPAITLDFASTRFPLRTFAFDGPVPTSAPVAAAARSTSVGVVLAWAAGSQSSSTQAALGLAEIAPTGARGALVPLGEMPVAPVNLVLAGSNDGATYLAIAWNGAVRAGFAARCAD